MPIQFALYSTENGVDHVLIFDPNGHPIALASSPGLAAELFADPQFHQTFTKSQAAQEIQNINSGKSQPLLTTCQC